MLQMGLCNLLSGGSLEKRRRGRKHAAAVCGWRKTYKSLEQATETRRLGVTDLARYVVRQHVGGFEKMLGFFDAQRLDIFNG